MGISGTLGPTDLERITMELKDLTGLNKGSKVVDMGAGCGRWGLDGSKVQRKP